MKLKQILLIVAVSALSAVGSVWIYNKTTTPKSSFVQTTADGKTPVNYAGFFDNTTGSGELVDFTKAANAAVPAVVHIKTKIPARKVSNQLPKNNRKGNSMEDLFERFFGDNDFWGPQIQPEQRASGSGVIISEDGYIITNNHVVSDGGDGVAEEITVTMHDNSKTYKASVIGRDPSTDLAVLKIDAKGLPFLLYGNSDNLQLGQWVLAVGYPLTLETTVTAGIISAKGRNIGINSRQSQTPIESFIQTDAAVNQGNSGGALITTEGQLVGINSAILAPNGTYAGYSFAIPVNLVKKIVNDLIKYGDVKRPYLGVSVDQENLESADGAHIGDVAKDGGAASAGLKEGDVITKINSTKIKTWNDLLTTVNTYNAGDKINIVYQRNGKEYNTTATLTNHAGTYASLSPASAEQKLGAQLENLDKKSAENFDVPGGVVVKKINDNGAISRTRMEQGFIITNINGMDINNVDELAKALASLKGKSVYVEGFYPDADGVYRYPLSME